MKKIVIVIAISIALSACSSQDNSSSISKQTKAATTSTTKNDFSEDISSAAEKEEFRSIEIDADVLSYDGNSILISFDSKEYELDLSECEYNSILNSNTLPDITDRIINNPFGIKTKVKLKCDPAFTKAYWCDAVTLNGDVSAPIPKIDKPKNELTIDSWSLFGNGSYSVYDFNYFEVTKEGKYQGSGRIDLSASDLFAAPMFSENEEFNVMCFKFMDEDCFIGLMTYSLFESKEETKDTDGNVISVSRSYFSDPGNVPVFFGHITDIDLENCKVKVELGGGAVCTLTPSVTIGCHSLAVGDKVVARFTDQYNYPDAPNQIDFDFAVIEKTDGLNIDLTSITDSKIYATDGERKITVISDTMLDAETLDPVTDKNIYSKVTIDHENIKYAVCKMGSEVIYVYYTSSAKLER